MCYHVLNRGNGQAEVFHKEDDYAAFLKLLCQASERVPMRLLTVMQYVDRNPVRAQSIPIRKAQRWPWSSIGEPPKDVERPTLHPSPVPRGKNWLRLVNEPQTQAELAAVRESVVRGSPFGSAGWKQATAKRLGLESSLRPRGRPRKRSKN